MFHAQYYLAATIIHSLFSDVYIEGKDKIMETLENIGIKLFVLAALKER